MNGDTLYWICAGLYFAIGIVGAVIYLTDQSDEDADSRKNIKSLLRPGTRCSSQSLDEVVVLVVIFVLLLWPIWFPFYWFGGSEKREAEEAMREFRQKYPKAERTDETGKDG